MSGKVVGVLGGGQLGRMLAASAALLNVNIVFLDVGENSPAKQIVSPRSPFLAHIDGSFVDREKIKTLASKVDILTVEIEHVDTSVLEEIQSVSGAVIHPSPSTVKTIQDKFIQKQHLQSHRCSVSEFLRVESNVTSIHQTAEKLGLPFMLKSRTLAYDGRAKEAISALGNRPLYAEKWVPFVKEIAVIVVRSTTGEVRSYPAVETVHKDNICHLVFAPLRSRDPHVAVRAQSIAEAAVKTFQGAGVFGVEMFLMEDAPRPHNSGHYTIEACETSQYENHLRAILSLPLGSTSLKVSSAAMLNIIGASSDMAEVTNFASECVKIDGCAVHLYGKSECRKGRKMGHVTIVSNSDSEVRSRLRPLLKALPSGSTEEELALYAPEALAQGSGFSHKYPLVGVIMGSDSDLSVMLPAAHILDRFKIPYELTIVSAHRTPDRLVEYARSASSRGLRTIIAGAGGAAHLPGMVAAMTALPVIGVPVKGSSLDGVDSLHSIVQMPRGIPVATVAINGGMNAGLLAVRILGAGMPHLFADMDTYLRGLESEVIAKVEKLEEVGWDKYEVKR
ncbi:phosphoribosylaminoimidazole carboxylase [Suillus occidentalis]|nr:phosphoribosylaminoimidazole carboxylase [Suillus occidentalis]